jgi:hypothetical protein
VAVGATATGCVSFKNCAATQPDWPSPVRTFCHATPRASGGLAAPIAVKRVPFASVRKSVAVELGSDRRFKPSSEFTYTSRVAGVGVAVGVAVGAGVGVSAIVGIAVGGGVLVGVLVDNGVAVAAGRAVLVATAAMAVGTLVGAPVGGPD